LNKTIKKRKELLRIELINQAECLMNFKIRSPKQNWSWSFKRM